MANCLVKMITLDLSKVSSSCLMVVSTKASGPTVKDSVVACRLSRMAPFSKDTGRMISKMAKEWKVGKMVADTKVDTRKG